MALEHHTETATYRPRSCFTIEGRPKRRYKTREDAEQVVRDIIQMHGDRVNSYECRCCGFYHVGHVPEWLV